MGSEGLSSPLGSIRECYMHKVAGLKQSITIIPDLQLVGVMILWFKLNLMDLSKYHCKMLA